MKRYLSAAAAVLSLTVLACSQLAAQRVYTGVPGEDIASVALHFGAIAPTRSLPDGSSFNTGMAGGVSGTVWPFRYLGFGGNLLVGQSGVTPGAGSNYRVTLEDPTVYLYSLELALRYPLGGGRFAWFPYIAGGGGGKTYMWATEHMGHTNNFNAAWIVSGGLDIRPAASPRFGFVVDVSRYSTTYSWHGFHWDNAGMRDLLITAGFTLNR